MKTPPAKARRIILGGLAATTLLYGALHAGRCTAPEKSRRAATTAPVAVPTQPGAVQLQDAPPVSLTDLSWSEYEGVRLPQAAADGPRDTRNGLAIGYSRTPRGAMLAAIHISLRANARWGPKVFEPTITEQVVGPGADQLLASAAETAQASKSTEKAQAYVVIEGFRWLGYTSETANLDLASAGPGDSDTTARAATRIQLQWRANDWRVVAPLGGGWGGTAYPIDSLDGFTLFPGRGR